MGLVGWMLIDRDTFLMSYAEERQKLEVSLFLMLGLGIILVFVGILACCGVCKKSRCNLTTAFCVMLVIIVWQTSFSVWVMFNSDYLKEILKSNMINTIKNEYGVIESRTQVVDAFQYELECCGFTGPADWAGSKYANKDPSLPFNLTVSGAVNNIYNVPESCCKMTDRNICNDTRQLKIGGIVNSAIHSEGCMDKLTTELMRQTTIIGIISIGFGLLQVLFVCTCIIYAQTFKARYKD
ncbi:PREDICTED: CD82 antigen [Dinoponera quadriceps]|uniref:Tetraspanin n=1 Tax=Dinoponera quadriceps TaxID=609295 RepID=A0A6P3XTD3_DINQU|nr:PREDICTED: CD82 antigen [Dinoponera quadriceps]